MAIIEAIQSLRTAGLSCRAIARRIGVHRETVARQVPVTQVSVAAQWLSWLLEQHARGLAAKRIHEGL